MEREAACFTHSQNLQVITNQNGLFLRMSLVFSTAIRGLISKFSSKRWINSGMAFRGEYLMQNTLEHHKDDEELILSQVLETSAPLKYFLSPRELKSLLNRAKAKGKTLPPEMERAYLEQISILSNMRELEESPLPDRRQKATEMTEKHTHSTQGEPQMVYVRRMMPLEYERLQGFPEGWTEIDTEH